MAPAARPLLLHPPSARKPLALHLAPLAQMYMYDAFLARQATSDFHAFSLDDVDAAFGRATPLRYHQTLHLHGRWVPPGRAGVASRRLFSSRGAARERATPAG